MSHLFASQFLPLRSSPFSPVLIFLLLPLAFAGHSSAWAPYWRTAQALLFFTLAEYIHEGSTQQGGGWGTKNRAPGIAVQDSMSYHTSPGKPRLCTSPPCEKTSHSWGLILGVLLCSSKVDWRFSLDSTWNLVSPWSTCSFSEWSLQSNCKSAILQSQTWTLRWIV